MIGTYVVKEGTVKNTLKLVILAICFDGYGKKPILSTFFAVILQNKS